MTAGELTKRVVFYEPTATTDALRGQAVSYTVVLCTVWANWRSLTSRESLAAQAMQVVPQYKVTIRHRADITTKMRLALVGCAGPVCEIVGKPTDPDGSGTYLEIDAVEVL
jgi:SPP1 family predicted phage head-tail adaptor